MIYIFYNKYIIWLFVLIIRNSNIVCHFNLCFYFSIDGLTLFNLCFSVPYNISIQIWRHTVISGLNSHVCSSISSLFWVLMYILCEILLSVALPVLPSWHMIELSAATHHFLSWEYVLHVTEYLQRWHTWCVTCGHILLKMMHIWRALIWKFSRKSATDEVIFIGTCVLKTHNCS